MPDESIDKVSWIIASAEVIIEELSEPVKEISNPSVRSKIENFRDQARFSQLCFASEKYLKALLYARIGKYPRTHDLQTLLLEIQVLDSEMYLRIINNLRKFISDTPLEIKDDSYILEIISSYYISSRYSDENMMKCDNSNYIANMEVRYAPAVVGIFYATRSEIFRFLGEVWEWK